MADEADSKSVAARRVGSSPTTGTSGEPPLVKREHSLCSRLFLCSHVIKRAKLYPLSSEILYVLLT